METKRTVKRVRNAKRSKALTITLTESNAAYLNDVSKLNGVSKSKYINDLLEKDAKQ